MPNYVDGFVIVVPKKKLAVYRAMATKASKVWIKYGALQYVECVGDDLKAAFGLPFPKLTKAKASDTVVFSYVVYKSKAQRNSINKKIMKDPVISAMCHKPMPFDIKKMTYGGFKVIVAA